MADTETEKVSIAPALSWTRRIGEHLGAYLQPVELDALYELYQAGQVQLWAIVNDEHVGTLATRIETAYDNQRQLVIIHSGGAILEYLPEIDAKLTEQAKLWDCSRILIMSASKTLADVLNQRLGFQYYEFTISREVA
jgi:hypothetical protein